MRAGHVALGLILAVLIAGAAAGADAGEATLDARRSVIQDMVPASRVLPAAEDRRQAESDPTGGGGAHSKVPSAADLRAARGYVASRTGVVSFAVVNSEGKLRAVAGEGLFSAASVVKALLLAAELRRLEDEGAPIDPETDGLLEAMITISDNEAADAIFARVGDAGLNAAAERAGMTGFTVAGNWGNAQITATDMARFFADLDHQFPSRSRAYAKGLLGSVIESQRWGVPAAAREQWAVRLKGGWLPDRALVHQAAELRERGGSRSLAVAVLTDEQPSFGYGMETVEGVAARLLSRDGSP